MCICKNLVAWILYQPEDPGYLYSEINTKFFVVEQLSTIKAIDWLWLLIQRLVKICTDIIWKDPTGIIWMGAKLDFFPEKYRCILIKSVHRVKLRGIE